MNNPCVITRNLFQVSIAVVLMLSAIEATAQTITVDTLEDRTDFGGARQVADLPGPDGRISFREACTSADNTAGPQTIAFAIPQSEWWLTSNQALLRLEEGAFFINSDEVTIDFTTQTDFTGDTNPNGWEVGIYGAQPNGWGVAALFINGNNCVIKGLDRVMQRGYGIHITGDNNQIISCTISGSLYAGVKVQGYVGDPATGNMIGGTLPDEGNILSGGNSGLRIDGPSENTTVIGNTMVGSPVAGVEIRGAYCCPEYTPVNTRIGGPTPQERNWIANNGSYGEEGFPFGSQVHVEWAVDTVIEGNYLGTTADGSSRFPNAHGTAGVSVRESALTVIRNNLISGIIRQGVNHYAGILFGVGISVSGLDAGVEITGNKIGTDASGMNPVPNFSGISIGWFQGDPAGAIIGGPNPGDANIIAFNERNGVTVSSGVTGIHLDRNSIHDNGELGIDLLTTTGQSGPTPNDPGDSDSGGNGLQNYPVPVLATTNGTSVAIEGTLNSSPNLTYKIQFFANSVCDPTGFGEAESFIGETVVTTDGNGDAQFAATFDGVVSAGSFISSTATNMETDATSEFSACIPIQSQTSPRAFNAPHGTNISGSVEDLATADGNDVSAQRDSTDINSWIYFELEGQLPMPSPSLMSLTMKASVFARSQVIQSIDLYNYDTNMWEEIDSRTAARMMDATITTEISGTPARFVQPGTNTIEARIRFESASQRQQFAAFVDQFVWTVVN
jgi:hypothetical protein